MFFQKAINYFFGSDSAASSANSDGGERIEVLRDEPLRAETEHLSPPQDEPAVTLNAPKMKTPTLMDSSPTNGESSDNDSLQDSFVGRATKSPPAATTKKRQGRATTTSTRAKKQKTILRKKQTRSVRVGGKKNMWKDYETEALVEGIVKYGWGNWGAIRNDFPEVLQDRDGSTDLKDKAVNLANQASDCKLRNKLSDFASDVYREWHEEEDELLWELVDTKRHGISKHNKKKFKEQVDKVDWEEIQGNPKFENIAEAQLRDRLEHLWNCQESDEPVSPIQYGEHKTTKRKN